MKVVHRKKLQLEDRLRFSSTVRSILFRLRFKRASKRLTTGGSAADAIRDLCSAARLAESPQQLAAVESVLETVDISRIQGSDLLEGDEDHHIPKALILKPYDPTSGEKGAVFISFEYQWARLLHATDLQEFARRYELVVSPTWTPPHSLVNWAFPRMYPNPVHCLISNRTDMETFPRLSSNYRMVELFASSWVDADIFDPRPRAERDIDILMLANFGTYKRHHVLFNALRSLSSDLRVVLVGQPNGQRSAEVLLREAEAFGVRDRIELRQRVSDEEVVDLLGRSKVSLINSRREGSCVAVVESMFADTPVGLLEGAQIGSAAFVNSHTGHFLRESHYASDLESFLARSDSYGAREWCLASKLSARDSCDRLNQILKEEAHSQGLPWTRDILPFHWRPNPMPFDAEPPAWLVKERALIEEQFGLGMGPVN